MRFESFDRKRISLPDPREQTSSVWIIVGGTHETRLLAIRELLPALYMSRMPVVILGSGPLQDASLVVDRGSIVTNCELLMLSSAQVGAQTEGERHACRASDRETDMREPWKIGGSLWNSASLSRGRFRLKEEADKPKEQEDIHCCRVCGLQRLCHWPRVRPRMNSKQIFINRMAVAILLCSRMGSGLTSNEVPGWQLFLGSAGDAGGELRISGAGVSVQRLSCLPWWRGRGDRGGCHGWYAAIYWRGNNERDLCKWCGLPWTTSPTSALDPARLLSYLRGGQINCVGDTTAGAVARLGMFWQRWLSGPKRIRSFWLSGKNRLNRKNNLSRCSRSGTLRDAKQQEEDNLAVRGEQAQ